MIVNFPEVIFLDTLSQWDKKKKKNWNIKIIKIHIIQDEYTKLMEHHSPWVKKFYTKDGFHDKQINI